jgi:serine protease Do
LRNTLTVGVISATQRHLRDDDAIYYLQTDAPINPGNSGGPLLDTEGRVIGMNTLIFSQSGGSEGIGFALPSSVIRREYELIRRDGRVRHGAIGVVPQTVTPALAKGLGLSRSNGVLLADVIPQSAAESAGLQVGDILISANGRPLREARDLIRMLYLFRRGETLEVELVRGSEVQKLKVAVLERPSEEDAMAELLSMEAELVRPIGIFAAPLDANVNAVMPNLRKLNGVAVVGVSVEFSGLNPGLQAGDVIYSVNKKPVASPAELRAALAAFQPGDSVVVHFEREKLLRFLAFELE